MSDEVWAGTDAAGAVFSADRRHRYSLHRVWHPGKPLGAFIGANPSKADEHRSDNTVTRCWKFADRFGWGGFYMLNLIAFVGTDPSSVPDDESAIGPLNDQYIRQVCLTLLGGQNVVAAWGHLGRQLGRGYAVAAMLAEAGVELKCLGTTLDGAPRHPSRLAGSTVLQAWRPNP